MTGTIRMPLAERLSSLPLILAGPVLRRVEANSVSVFVACRVGFVAKLYVANAAGLTSAASIRSASYIAKSSTATQAVQLGPNFHVLVLTAPTSGAVMSPYETYQYSIEFTFLGATGTQWLDDPGVFTEQGGTANIAYPPFFGPTFRLPGATPGELKFAHGSCRKPHGGKTDVLVALDDILSQTASGSNRPQQLFLTGDQIYADDVDDCLLFLLREAGEALMQGAADELLPGNPQTLAPGQRQAVADLAGFTTEDGQSHLLFLREFYAMYLFSWSKVLWPGPGQYPTYEEVYQVPTPPPPPPRTFSGNDPDLGIGTYVTPPIQQIPQEKQDYLNRVIALDNFQRPLDQVQRALANIPSYMMLDDHEITDDWFLSADWCTNTLTVHPATQKLGGRIITNGLAAFAVFQAWGNTPDRFAPSTLGATILGTLAQLADTNFVHTTPADMLAAAVQKLPTWNALEYLLTPSLVPFSGAAGATRLEYPLISPYPASWQWHFHIAFDAYHLVMLDTRTQRGYTDNLGSPQLIPLEKLATQIPVNISTNFVLLVSPAPVTGYIPVEFALDIGHDLISNGDEIIAKIVGGVANLVVPEACGEAGEVTKAAIDLCLDVITEVYDFKTALKKYASKKLDFEAWSTDADAFHDLLDFLSVHKRVVILSGDVHYGFSNVMKYWNDRYTPLPGTASSFVQLCSSAIKNTATLSQLTSYYATSSLAFDPIQAYVYFGTISDGHSHAYRVPLTLDTPPFQYVVAYANDNRSPAVREIPTVDLTPAQAVQLATVNPMLLSEILAIRLESESLVVGSDNLGLVEIGWTATEQWVDHHFYWCSSLNGDDIGALVTHKPHTLHSLDLTPPSAGAKPWS